jgi:hypothetical protein
MSLRISGAHLIEGARFYKLAATGAAVGLPAQIRVDLQATSPQDFS